MSTPPSLPQPTWLDRSSLVMAGFLSFLGVAALASEGLHLDFVRQPFAVATAMNPCDAICIFFLGLALVGLERGWRATPYLALAPALLAAAFLAEDLLHVDLHLDALLASDLFSGGAAARMSALFAGCIVLTALVLTWDASRPGVRAPVFAEAATGSIAAAAGFSAWLGYVADLPALYRWASSAATSLISAIALLLLGACVLLRAWREARKTEGAAPTWAPMPVVVGCLTLTIILWTGLRERERAYVTARTQTSIDTLANTLAAELERQAAAIERLARRWADAPASDEARWQNDARIHWEESAKAAGCVAVARVNSALRTTWVFPTNDQFQRVGFDHSAETARRAALDVSRLSGAPIISDSVNEGKLGQGLAIYSPMFREGRLAGFVAADFLYRSFFDHVVTEQKLLSDYAVKVQVANQVAYDSQGRAAPSPGSKTALEKTYRIFNRPVTIALTPSERAVASERRFLPELALASGVGITLLLGLSVHLGRRSRAGQRAAELSNRKLQAENEERRRIEARLKVSDERLRLALDSTQIGIFEWNVSSGHVYFSPGLWAMLGYDHNRIPPSHESWQNIIHPDDVVVYQRRVDAQLAGHASFIEPEYRVRARSGEWRWVYTRAKTVASNHDGKPARIIGTVQDISARREAEQALRESQAEARKLSLVASKTDNPVLIATAAGTIEWVNESFTRVMEYSLDEVVGKAPADFMDGPETDPQTVARIRAAMAKGEGISTDVVNYSKSGRKYHLRLQIQPIRDESDQLQNFIAIETDITARVDSEKTLRRAKAEADEASRAKSEFLASMSHEIRTPMNGVIGMTSLLLETQLTTEQLDFINTIRASGEALLTIINDILDFSKIESGKLELEQAPFEVAVCIEEALDLFALQASAKKLEMVYNISPGVPAWVVGDITRLRQILVNLVNNAVKFTPSGSIVIDVQRLPIASGGQQFMLEFTVRDTGIGIPAERRDRLFKAFSQVDSSTTRKYGGTGLGLVISQRLCILMGGGIRVESTEGEGATFVFTIVTEAAPQQIEPPFPLGLEAIRGGLVLCVEDHLMTQRRIRTLLENVGANCVFAPTAAAAAALVPTLPTRPVLVIIDADEPGSRPPFLPLQLRVPRLLMVPFGQTAPDVPSDGYPFASIFKPFKTASFLHTVGLLFSSPPAAVLTSHTASIFSPQLAQEFPLDVLLAEDNAVNQKVALRFLERLGYRADTVSNGLEALTTLEARHYHLVLMDLQMPEMDGLEASRQIRRRLSRDRQPKIIALTANAMQGDRQRCMEAGMDDYISKPVKLLEIENSIRRLFGKSEALPPVGEASD